MNHMIQLISSRDAYNNEEIPSCVFLPKGILIESLPLEASGNKIYNVGRIIFVCFCFLSNHFQNAKFDFPGILESNRHS